MYIQVNDDDDVGGEIARALSTNDEFWKLFLEFNAFVEEKDRSPPNWHVESNPCSTPCVGSKDCVEIRTQDPSWCDWRWFIVDDGPQFPGADDIDRIIAYGFSSHEEAEQYVQAAVKRWWAEHRAQ